MTVLQQIITIGVVVVATQLTRWLPFLVFRREEPAYMRYLGRVLPAAIFGMLVVYCYRNVDFLHASAHGLPELVAGAVVALLQARFKNMAVSILVGTALYALWVNLAG